MRVKIPDRIGKLAEKIEPYMEYNKESGYLCLRSDAPAEIVSAQREFHEWMSSHLYL